MTTLHIRGRVFAAEEYDFDEHTGLVYAHGVMVDNPTVRDIAVPVGSIDFFDLTEHDTVDGEAVETTQADGLSPEQLANLDRYVGGSE
jgi:hypothetical protein